jgi:RND family efflux transporter MFP subunit
MDLVPLAGEDDPDDPDGHAGHAHGTGEPAAGWSCPLHPSIVEPESGSCPICGTELKPVAPEEPQASAGGGGSGVRIDPAVIQTMNVRTEVVERRSLSRRTRTVGYLEYDQERMVTVTTKYSGWIEKVHVNYVGEKVHKGDPLFEIYSPELVQTEEELLAAMRFAERMQDAPAESRRRAEALVGAARTRLGYWDVGEAQIRRLIETGEVFRTLTVPSPASGLVMKRMPGLEGMAVKPGMELFHLANLSTLWLTVEVFEDQIPWMRPGVEAEVTFPYFPGESFEGKVRILEPSLSEATRTLAVKLAVPNREGRLRAGMFATVVFRSEVVADAVAVPLNAVLRTGERNVAVVAVGDPAAGRFAPRELVLGVESEGYVQVLAGLEAGERVVTSAQFLIDSEASLKEAIRGMVGDHVH